MKKLRRLICAGAVMWLLSGSCLGAESELFESQYDALELSKLENAAPRSAADIELSSELTFEGGLAEIASEVRQGIGEFFSQGITCITVIAAISALCAVVSAMGEAGERLEVKRSVSLVGAIAIVGAASGSVFAVMSMGENAIENIDAFSKMLIPTFAAACAASGRPGAAISSAAATVLFSDILISLIKNVFLPLVYLNLGVAAAGAATENSALERISKLITKSVSWALRVLLGAFVSYITITGIVSGSADKLSMSLVSTASSAVPVVGNIMAKAAGGVLAGAAVIKNTVGVFGLLVIIATCIMPVAALSVNYALFKLAAVFASPVIDGKLSELTESIGTSFGLVLALVASSGAVIFISVVMGMFAAGGA